MRTKIMLHMNPPTKRLNPPITSISPSQVYGAAEVFSFYSLALGLICFLILSMISSASLSILLSRTSQVGISLMRPIAMPALQIPYSGSPMSYTTFPLAPDTRSRNSANCAPPGLRSSATTCFDTEFLNTRAVLFRLRKIWTVSCSVDATIFSLMPWWIGLILFQRNNFQRNDDKFTSQPYT